MDAGEAPDAAAKAAVVAAAPAVDAAEMITCIVCLHLFCMNDFPSKKSTRYAGHCPKCSLQLRGILNASKGSLPTTSAADEAAGCSEMSGAGDDTSKYLQNLAKEDPEKYRQIFKEYGESGSAAGKRGRGNQRQPFNPRTEMIEIYNPKTGKNEKHQHVWVQTSISKSKEQIFDDKRSAAFREVETKLENFYGEHPEMAEKAKNLKEHGITEDRLVNDSSLDLGDTAACIRIMFTILGRHLLLKVLSIGSKCMSLDGLTDDQKVEDRATENALVILKSDAFLQENANKVQAYIDYCSPEKLYENLPTKEGIDEQNTELMEAVKAVKACIAAAKRSMTDYAQMIKSTKKAREKYEEHMAKANNPNSSHGGLQGRPNLQQMADSDPEVLKCFKAVIRSTTSDGAEDSSAKKAVDEIKDSLLRMMPEDVWSGEAGLYISDEILEEEVRTGMQTLVAGFVKTGDLWYIPSGYLLVEKSLTDSSIAVRTLLGRDRGGADAVCVASNPVLDLVLNSLPDEEVLPPTKEQTVTVSRNMAMAVPTPPNEPEFEHGASQSVFWDEESLPVKLGQLGPVVDGSDGSDSKNDKAQADENKNLVPVPAQPQSQEVQVAAELTEGQGETAASKTDIAETEAADAAAEAESKGDQISSILNDGGGAGAPEAPESPEAPAASSSQLAAAAEAPKETAPETMPTLALTPTPTEEEKPKESEVPSEPAEEVPEGEVAAREAEAAAEEEEAIKGGNSKVEKRKGVASAEKKAAPKKAAAAKKASAKAKAPGNKDAEAANRKRKGSGKSEAIAKTAKIGTFFNHQ
ncbi:unnamed protein product [Durusdinium trenchii]|uniref:Uncharacterized protein n=1 Tax=Durusdinium trenchii TaxID=1381693 RepID=A0ABP0LLS6_9DINO